MIMTILLMLNQHLLKELLIVITLLGLQNQLKNGECLSTITVAATTIYNMKGDKNLRFYIVDSNHRFQACLSLKVPFNMIIIRLNTIEDINNLMSDLNNTSKPWSLDNHITNCAGLQGIVGQH